MAYIGSGPTRFNTADGLTVTDDAEIGDNATVGGNLSVTGTTTLTGDVTVDTDTLFVDASTNNVGIGTSSPSTKLNVASTEYEDHILLDRTGVGSMHITATNPRGVAITDGTTSHLQVLQSTGDFQFNSGYGSVATAYGCRAWVNFDGTGTVSIRESGNVGSITDQGTGEFTINFSTAMPDANYAAVASGRNNEGYATASFAQQFSTSVRVGVYSNGSLFDVTHNSIAIIR